MIASIEFKVGLFVIISLSLSIGSVIALGSGKFFVDTQIIETSTKDSVNGLQIGSPVKYRGVPIGEVKSIAFVDSYYPEADSKIEEFDFESSVVIRMAVRLDVFGNEQAGLFSKNIENGVKLGLRTRLTSLGLTGGLYVDLDLSDSKNVTAQKLNYEPKYPFVPNEQSRFDQLVDHFQVIAAGIAKIDFGSLGASLQSVLSNLDGVVTQRIDPMMLDVGKFVADLRVSNNQLQAILSDPKIASSLGSAEAFMAELKDGFASSSGGLREGLAAISPMLKSARDATEKLDAILGSEQVKSILSGLDAAGHEIGPTVASYRGIGNQVQEFIQGKGNELQQLITALRQASQNLADFTSRIRRDPPSLFFADPPKKLAPGAKDEK